MSSDSQDRTVTAHAELQVAAEADLVWSVAISSHVPTSQEQMTITVDGTPITPALIEAPNGNRLHRLAHCPPGRLVLDYAATAPGNPPVTVPTAQLAAYDEILFSRPSRYCDSDRLAAVAATHFGGLAGAELVAAVQQWVLAQIAYVPGSTRPIDGALDVYLSRQGVCRDSAQLVVTFLRACNTPARLVSVYAPGLSPMDFHAVAEVLLDGAWYVIDGTGLAPRQSLARIATGRDAADTAFLTVNTGLAELLAVEVTATTAGDLPVDDHTGLVQIA